jgi:uncharacterized protein
MYWIAFVTGLVGSLHCLGMCGPIALALPFNKNSSLASLLPGRLTYNIGRLISYMIIGLILGSIGNMLAIAGFQQNLSILSGVILILIAISGFLGLTKGKALVNKWMSKMFRGRFKSDKISSMLSIGILNGFLPCGLVYMAATMALTEANPIQAAGFMLVFGVGTYPLMLLVSLSPALLSSKRRMRIKNLAPYIAMFMGILFILRGSNLDIKYISPKVDIENETMECCDDD